MPQDSPLSYVAPPSGDAESAAYSSDSRELGSVGFKVGNLLTLKSGMPRQGTSNAGRRSETDITARVSPPRRFRGSQGSAERTSAGHDDTIASLDDGFVLLSARWSEFLTTFTL
jgi:hypothetical protein